MESVKCKVWITTLQDGKRSVFHSDGSYERTERGVKVAYSDNEDLVELLVEPPTAAMERRGETGLCVRFVQGETTEFSLGLGEMKGTIPVMTRLVELGEGQDRILISLHYDLLFGKTSTQFQLKIQLIFSEAK